MSSRHAKPRQFDAESPEFAVSGPDADVMRDLQYGSEAILRLASDAHAAIARSDAAAAEAARHSLEKQLKLTTTLIDTLLFGSPERSVLH
ncbi:hypothetical protein [Paraburkholderia antibiotica]|uniref:Uncharacterized protein n=1 Tax=Paraburkholderia antibiotica TaxID=2728839 RepID=A0A7X9ZZI1_9BURK|nr:hypothetical protein [Paraburkholderia antibiotica]NML32678.1 hypothetical protein [Paraburkholderia antibiotica]